MRSNCGRVPVLRGHQQLRETSKQDKATAGGARPGTRSVSRNNPMAVWLETSRSHALHLGTTITITLSKNASMTFIESSNNR
jgi:hypothetical protein